MLRSRPIHLLANKVASHIQAFDPTGSANAAVLPLSTKPSRPGSPIGAIRFPRRRLRTLTLFGLCVCVLFWVLNRAFVPAAVWRSYDPWLAPTDGLLPPARDVWGNVSVADYASDDYHGPTERQRMLLPPTYPRYKQYEVQLSRHNLARGKGQKYLYVANHAWGTGFGNVMQDYVLHAILAVSLNRLPVFDNYTWSNDMSKEFSEYNGKLIPSRIPLTTMLSGPMAGGAFPDGAPPTISRSVFDEVCHGRKRVYETQPFRDTTDPWMDGKELFDKWSKELAAIDDDCLEITPDQDLVFDIWLYGMGRLHSLMDTYMNSVVVKYFSFSPLIHHMFNTNIRIFAPALPTSLLQPLKLFTSFLSPSSSLFRRDESLSSTPFHPPPPARPWNTTESLSNLLVLHIRHGDFKDHCQHLAKWSAEFHGFPTMLMANYSKHAEDKHPDEFFVPEDHGWGENTPENYATYTRRCFPTIEQIVEKVRELRQSYEQRHENEAPSPVTSLLSTTLGALRGTPNPPPTNKLSKIYIMTNAKLPWLEELRAALQVDAGPYEPLDIHSSRELIMNHEEKIVAQTLDMYVATRAGAFIGNGFSSLTGNVVMLRMARGLHALDTRFW